MFSSRLVCALNLFASSTSPTQLSHFFLASSQQLRTESQAILIYGLSWFKPWHNDMSPSAGVDPLYQPRPSKAPFDRASLSSYGDETLIWCNCFSVQKYSVHTIFQTAFILAVLLFFLIISRPISVVLCHLWQ